MAKVTEGIKQMAEADLIPEEDYMMAVREVRVTDKGWEIARLWLYLTGSAMFLLVGIQLVIYWILLRVLDELSQREVLIQKDMGNI